MSQAICIHCGQPVVPDASCPNGNPNCNVKHVRGRYGYAFWSCLEGTDRMAEVWPAPTAEPAGRGQSIPLRLLPVLP